MSKITSIYLENFQSIREAVELPIRPLTFLYGPNSAGKSAVHDALHLLNVAITSGDGLSDLVRRWTHTNTPATERTAMVVGATFRVRGEFGGAALIDQVEFPDEFADHPLSIFEGNIDADLSIRQELDSDHMDPGRLSIWLDKRMVLEVWTDKPTGETLVALNPDYFGQSLKDVIARYGLDPERPESYEVECYFERAPVRLRAISREDNDRRGLSNAILAIANYVLTAAVSWYRMPSLVAADRGLVDDSYLTFLAHAAAHVGWLEHADPLIRADIDGGSAQPAIPVIPSFSRLKHLVHLGLLQRPGNPMMPIGESRLAAHVQESVKKLEMYGLCLGEDMYAQAMQKFGVLIASPDEPLHNYVNRCLSDHLFLDQGYQIDFDICEVIRPDGIGPPTGFPYVTKASSWGGYSLHVFALIACFLRDRSRHLITFSDVGTGLSCVLPVLSALHSGFSFSQQPELHLHPAMQSALGDIYIERTGTNDERHLIESHSEYILLRCLRRIRETGAGKHLPGDPMALGPDQISILYFDPQQNGATKIRKVRVTKDGEFIDRWPRGFFEERGKDLFDE
jgi:hypothetical protein